MVTEAEWEEIALEALFTHGWTTLSGSEILPGNENGRTSWDDIVLPARLLAAMRRLNPRCRGSTWSRRSRRSCSRRRRTRSPRTTGCTNSWWTATAASATSTDGCRAEPDHPAGQRRRVDDNDWLAVNQVTIAHGGLRAPLRHRAVLNGMPVVIIELKKAGSAHADLAAAHAQLQTYLREFPMAFRFCVFTLVSRRDHRPSTARRSRRCNHFSPWNVDDDGVPVTPGHR